MKFKFYFISLFLLCSAVLFSHEGHQHADALMLSAPETTMNLHEGGLIGWILWLGHLHLVFLHFPIALIIMTVVAEILFFWHDSFLFDHAARFMITAAAILAPITALFGFALGFGQFYEGSMNDIYAWHRYFGVVTAILALWAATLREHYARGKSESLKSYYTCLFFAFLVVNLTGLFGGILAFGFPL
ncbi:hypothetical protein PNK_2083 [Candidatus Protochlamydia naegleriophila]|uniref:DUF2231 domain-containing protein n=1 Tax=Candidatus Protochlamydia naegleriophila TaxID=389348 RepID=A0A0U5JEU8_9BACT|nr:DUF2231 domain-containing protein [Candidatus Protochlamydia naegleriophila]CUI17687.1 hypothetical protein PNK_2083 [Candidatus Protochlamydia naegleriophila]